jgi:hypothetical protein
MIYSSYLLLDKYIIVNIKKPAGFGYA